MKHILSGLHLKAVEVIKLLRDPRPDLITPVPEDAPTMIVRKMGHTSVTGRVQTLDHGRVKVTTEGGETVIIGPSALYSIEPAQATPPWPVKEEEPLNWTDPEQPPVSGGWGNGSAGKAAPDHWISDGDIAAVIESSLIELLRDSGGVDPTQAAEVITKTMVGLGVGLMDPNRDIRDWYHVNRRRSVGVCKVAAWLSHEEVVRVQATGYATIDGGVRFFDVSRTINVETSEVDDPIPF